MKVKLKVSLKRFEAELGAGYDYLFGAGLSVDVPDFGFDGGDTVWEGRKKRRVLFTITAGPVPIPVWITWRPFLAYDYDVQIQTTAGASIQYQVSGGDYGALVAKGNEISTKRETMEPEYTEPGDIVTVGEECNLTVVADYGLSLGIEVKFWDLPYYTASPAVRAGIEAVQTETCDGSLDAPSGSRFTEEPDETRGISPTLVPRPFRVKTFDVDFKLSIPIGFELRICFELKIDLGLFEIDISVCVIETDAEVEITLWTFTVLTLPKPELVRETYQCLLPSGILTLDVDIQNGTDEGDGEVPNTLFFPTSWVLLFNDTDWSTASEPALEGMNGTIEIIPSGDDDFCCGAANMPVSDLFHISTPLIPFRPHGLITYAGTQDPNKDGALCKLLQNCTLVEFYNVAIGDEICDMENCNWTEASGQFGKNYCNWDGVTCNNADEMYVTELDRTSKEHLRGSRLIEEIQYLKFLKSLQLGFEPFCAQSGNFSCLEDVTAEGVECVMQNCTGAESVVDDETNETCWIEPQDNATLECFSECFNGDYGLDERTVCLDYMEDRPDETKIEGTIPAVLWSMGEDASPDAYPLGAFVCFNK